MSVANATLLDYETAVSHDITVLASSSDGSTANETFTINVVNYEPPNQPPIAHDDTGYSIDNDDTLTIAVSDLVSNDTDADGDALTITSVSNTVGGTVELVTPAGAAPNDPTPISVDGYGGLNG